MSQSSGLGFFSISSVTGLKFCVCGCWGKEITAPANRRMQAANNDFRTIPSSVRSHLSNVSRDNVDFLYWFEANNATLLSPAISVGKHALPGDAMARYAFANESHATIYCDLPFPHQHRNGLRPGCRSDAESLFQQDGDRRHRRKRSLEWLGRRCIECAVSESADSTRSAEAEMGVRLPRRQGG